MRGMRLARPGRLMDRRKADLAHQPADAPASDRPSKAAKMANHLARAVEGAFQKRLIDKPHEGERSALRRPASDRAWRARQPPVRTGGQSRAVDDLDRSCSSSDQGSAIEGFRQKIPLDDKLSDLGVQLRHFRVPVGGGFESLVVEHLGQLLDSLTLPSRNQIGMQLMPLRQVRHRSMALYGLKRDLGLELGRKTPPGLPERSSFSSKHPH